VAEAFPSAFLPIQIFSENTRLFDTVKNFEKKNTTI
jgi:hypothetical protein